MEVIRRENGKIEKEILRPQYTCNGFDMGYNYDKFQVSYNSDGRIVFRKYVDGNNGDILICLDDSESRELIRFISKLFRNKDENEFPF